MSVQVLVSKTQNRHFGAKVPFLPDRLTHVLVKSSGNSGSLAARRTSLPDWSRPGRACLLDDWPRRFTCNELESAVSSFFGSSSA